MPWSLSLTITTRSLYAVTVDWVSEVGLFRGIGGGPGGGPLAWAATCAQDAAAALPPPELAAWVVLNLTESLMIAISLCMFCVHLAASWTCWRISPTAGCR